MQIKDKNGNMAEIHAHPGGYLYYFGKDYPGCDIESMTSEELAYCDIQTDKSGRLFIQKGGQKKLYIDNAHLSDKGGTLVKDYLNMDKDYEVTIVLTCKVKAPDDTFAKAIAENRMSDLRDIELCDSAVFKTTLLP